MPERIQRSRAKGWRMPENTIYVGRGSKWGNPHIVGVSLERNGDGSYRRMTPADAVARYRDEYFPFWRQKNPKRFDVSELRGKNLACWCKPQEACHADVLLEVANS